MKTWNTPRVEIEQFEANEYVSACYVVDCYKQKYSPYHTNEPTYNINVIKTKVGTSYVYTYTVEDNAGHTYSAAISANSNLTENTYINWTTSSDYVSGAHYGWATSDTTNPNRS